ncbi:endonuclease MutS2 [Paenibacillus sp. CAU 1782]
MNEATLKTLEYDKVKESIADLAVSSAGKMLVEEMKPLTEIRAVESRLRETEEGCRLLARGASIPLSAMDGIQDLLLLLGKGRVYNEQELEQLAVWLTSVAQMKRYMVSKHELAPTISGYGANLDECPRLREELQRCLRYGQLLDEASPELGYIRRHIYAVEDKIEKRMNQLMGKYRSYLQEAVISRRGGRLVLAVKREQRKFVPGSVLDESASGQTLFVEPTDIGALQGELADWKAAEERERYAVLAALSQQAEVHGRALFANREVMAILDYITARAKWSQSCGGRRITTASAPVIVLRDARHPLLGRECEPLNVELGLDWKQLIITGPNTGGKTIALKTIGLLALLHQSGLLVPAGEGSTLGLFTHIAADIGDGQSLEQSLSTFSAHLSVLSAMLNEADSGSLLLLDEMAAGTDPSEGISLSIAVLETLLERRSLVAATTHFNEIKTYAGSTEGCMNARMAFHPDTLRPLYRLEIGEAGESHAFDIARRYGLPDAVLARAQALLQQHTKPAPDTECYPGRKVEGNKERPEGKGIRQHESRSGKKQAQVNRRNGLNETGREKEENAAPTAAQAFQKGDSVWIYPLRRAGIVFRPADERGNVIVQVKGEKLTFNRKRLKLYIQKGELYPGEDYDMAIVFDTKENRKARHQLERKHVEGLEIVTEAKDVD